MKKDAMQTTTFFNSDKFHSKEIEYDRVYKSFVCIMTGLRISIKKIKYEK